MTLAAVGLIVQLLVSDDCKVMTLPEYPVIVQVPVTAVVELPANCRVRPEELPEVEAVKPEKLEFPVKAWVLPSPPLKVIVPELAVKVPPLLQLPETEKLLELLTVAELAMATLTKVKLPELVMEEPLLKVIVPEEGVNTPEPPTVKVPPTVALLAPVAMALVLMVRWP